MPSVAAVEDGDASKGEQGKYWVDSLTRGEVRVRFSRAKGTLMEVLVLELAKVKPM